MTTQYTHTQDTHLHRYTYLHTRTRLSLPQPVASQRPPSPIAQPYGFTRYGFIAQPYRPGLLRLERCELATAWSMRAAKSEYLSRWLRPVLHWLRPVPMPPASAPRPLVRVKVRVRGLRLRVRARAKGSG